MSLFEEDILNIMKEQLIYEKSLDDHTLIKRYESKEAAKVHVKYGEELNKDDPRVYPKTSILTRWQEYCPNVKILDYDILNKTVRFQAVQDASFSGLIIANKTIRLEDILCITRFNIIGEDKRNSRMSFDDYEEYDIDDEDDKDDETD